jgi:hypothetical protein
MSSLCCDGGISQSSDFASRNKDTYLSFIEEEKMKIIGINTMTP